MVNAFLGEGRSLYDCGMQRPVKGRCFDRARSVNLFKMRLKSTDNDKLLTVNTQCRAYKSELEANSERPLGQCRHSPLRLFSLFHRCEALCQRFDDALRM